MVQSKFLTLECCTASVSDVPAIIAVSSKSVLTLTHNVLRTAVSSFQTKLSVAGITTGDTVAACLPNSAEFVVALLGTVLQRAVSAPLNPAYKQEEFEFYLEDLKPKLVLVPRGAIFQDFHIIRAARRVGVPMAEVFWAPDGATLLLELTEKALPQRIASVQKPQSSDIALVLHTSGTTGRPKAHNVPLTHGNLCRTIVNIQHTYDLSPADRTMLVMPLFHVHGILASLLSPLSSGGSAVIPLRFSVSTFWDDFITHEANWYSAVPTIHQLLEKSPRPRVMPHIRFVRSCSSPLAPAMHAKLEAMMNAPVLEAYAITEASHQMTSNELPPGLRKAGSVGKPQGVDMIIANENGQAGAQGSIGEVCVRGANVTENYLSVAGIPIEKSRSFFADDSFRTGDQGYLDADGFLFLTGRIKELINKGGEKISPVEIDNFFMQHASVGEAVSFGIDDELCGQNVAVAIELRQNSPEVSPEELTYWFAERAAKFKIPKQVHIVSSIPKTATGKVQRRFVAQSIMEQSEKKAKKGQV